MEDKKIENEKIPNLFIVGAPKCGTSSLHTWLSMHPQIFMSNRKEPQYFCRDFWEEGDTYHNKKLFFDIRKVGDYLNLFEDTKENHIILGEATSKYLYSKIAAKEIYKFNPKAKIIIMLRNPVDFLYSYHSQCLYDLAENEPNFEKALALEDTRKDGKNIPKYTPAPSFAYYSEISKFYDQIKRFMILFGKEQLKIVLIDDLKNNPSKVYRDVLKFLGVNSNFKPTFQKINENKIITNKFLHRINMLPPNQSVIKRIYRKIFPKKLREKISEKKIFMKSGTRNKMHPSLRRKLKKIYYNEVMNLSKLLRRDLINKWGYNKD